MARRLAAILEARPKVTWKPRLREKMVRLGVVTGWAPLGTWIRSCVAPRREMTISQPVGGRVDFSAVLLGTVVAAALMSGVRAAEEAASVRLWPGKAPGEQGVIAPEKVDRSAANPNEIQRVTNVSDPVLAVFPAPVDKRTDPLFRSRQQACAYGCGARCLGGPQPGGRVGH